MTSNSKNLIHLEKGFIYAMFHQIFICFAAEDRYKIVEPIVYHLKNYGINTWYDRHTLLMGDNRVQKNLNEGVTKCKYALIILSKDTEQSICAMEEISIIKERCQNGDVTIFPVLFEISPNNIPYNLQWIKEFIYKEVNRHSGTLEICNNIACKITSDMIALCPYKTIQDILGYSESMYPLLHSLIYKYQKIDNNNLNSRVTMLYATYLVIIHSENINDNPTIHLISTIFERLFSETQLNLKIDYRELWLLENSLCLLVNSYFTSCIESII